MEISNAPIWLKSHNLMQVYIGNYRAKKAGSKRQPGKTTEENQREKDQIPTTITEARGQEFVAFEHPQWSDKPLIGKVISKDSSTTTIHWWLGRYRGAWKECSDEPSAESIHIIYTFYWDTIGTNCKLSKELIRQIREGYQQSNFTF